MSGKYDSDLTDEQWRLIKPLIPRASKRGRKPICRRRIINAILYWCRTGCQWRYLPRCFPNWSTVYGVFRKWKLSGVWKSVHDRLVRKVRKQAGRNPVPSTGIIDSQSIRTAEGGVHRGFDGAKKITGRKRHILVDTLGMILQIVVHGANWQDHEGAHFVLHGIRERFKRLRRVFADSAYGRMGLPKWSQETCGVKIETVNRPAGTQGFEVLPKRWIVERTIAWLNRYRRLAKDYERDPETDEAVVHIAMTSLMLKRLTKNKSHF